MGLASFADVVVCGAGPAGLLAALGLAQQGIDTVIIEKRERHVQEMFGRACTLYPRTLELLEQLDVVDEMIQAGFSGRSYAVFKDGKHVTRKAWQSMFPMTDNSFHNYILNIRQKNSERIFASRYERDFGKSVHYGWEIVDQRVDKSLEDGYNVTVTISHVSLGKQRLRCKYLIGADGGNSTVRRLAGIAMEGNETTYRWVRLDGRIKTDMPEPNLVFAALETKKHGNVLWVRLDRDAHRIGFALTPSLQAKYPNGITQEEAISEAVESVKPFQLEVERLDWWTQYNVKQKVAATLQKDEYILLIGDAGHTHSSAFAQGMNTGVHDATNLIWKLAGTVKGWYGPGVLATYAQERRAAAEKLVSIDRLAAAAASGDIPAGFQQAGMSNEDAMWSILETNMSFTIGLGVSYTDKSVISRTPSVTTLPAGGRSPDALIYPLGPSIPIRLHSITHQGCKGRWSVLVFTGYHYLTKSKVVALRERTTDHGSAFANWAPRLNMATLTIGHVGSAWEAFDGPALGNLYFDPEAIAHSRHGVYPNNGGMVIVRPDGVFAFAARLDELDKIEEFFESVFISEDAS